MIGDGRPAFVPGFRRYRVVQGAVPSYVIVGVDGKVVGADREPWLGQRWRVLRDRLVKRGAVIEGLDAEDEGAG